MPEAAAVDAMPLVRAALAAATARLAAVGDETARLDAEVLLATVLGVDRARLVLDASTRLDEQALADYEALITRRQAHEPVAYLTGSRGFRAIEVQVDRRVLIPRPETELLVEVALGLPEGARVADVGTGSGAVALALAQERPDLLITGIDVSADALAVARANASRLGLGVRFVEADLLDCAGYDAVVANLPYVATNGPSPAPDVAGYEPQLALYAGDDGLELIRRLITRLDRVGWVALEVGFDQAAVVGELLHAAGFRQVQRFRDLAGHDRVVVGRR